MRARVLVRPRAGILDPQGQVVARALPALGFHGVGNVHVGRLIELDIEDPGQLAAMCEGLLTNPLVEDYEVLAEDGTPLAGEATRPAPPLTTAPAKPAPLAGPTPPPAPPAVDPGEDARS